MTGKLQGRQIRNSPVAYQNDPPRGAKAAASAPGTREAAAYIRDIAADLRDLADAAQLPLLAYLLDMARMEANCRLK